MSLVPCHSCRRHLRSGERSCPFCAAAQPDTAAPVLPAGSRVGRAASLLFAGTLAAGACARSGAEAPRVQETPAAPQAAATDASSATPTAPGPDPTTPVAPPPPQVVTLPPDGGAVAAMYGAPPMRGPNQGGLGTPR